jgi:AIG2 family protein
VTVDASTLYFAYGSNMSSPRMQARVPDAVRMGAACVDGWVLRFHKPSQDGSGKADIVPVTGDHARVWGVLWSVGDAGWQVLDQVEGAGYERVPLLVLDTAGDTRRIAAYRAVESDRGLSPYGWYREHAVRGAIEAGLPADYVARLRVIASIQDPDPERAARELAIYAG